MSVPGVKASLEQSFLSSTPAAVWKKWKELEEKEEDIERKICDVDKENTSLKEMVYGVQRESREQLQMILREKMKIDEMWKEKENKKKIKQQLEKEIADLEKENEERSRVISFVFLLIHSL
jgi:5'-deoxynucleotidase YfbR-like HD superfamily hydrolase